MTLMDDINKFNDFLTKYKNKETDAIPEDYSDTDDFKLDDFINDESNWQEDPTWRDFVDHDLESDKKAASHFALDKSDYDPDDTYYDDEYSWIDDLLSNEEDVNADGDTDVTYSDSDSDGDIDTAKIEADTPEEAAKSIDKATNKLSKEKDQETTTGKSKKELETDDTQKNITDALKDLNF